MNFQSSIPKNASLRHSYCRRPGGEGHIEVDVIHYVIIKRILINNKHVELETSLKIATI